MTEQLPSNAFAPEQALLIDNLKREVFPQGQAHLETDRGLCCLGVACKLLAPEEARAVSGTLKDGATIFAYYGEPGSAPRPIQAKLGLRGSSGDFAQENGILLPHRGWEAGEEDPFVWRGAHSLIDLNDEARWTFAEIGWFIEQNPGLVFTNFGWSFQPVKLPATLPQSQSEDAAP